jgi:hypothetical protein
MERAGNNDGAEDLFGHLKRAEKPGGHQPDMARIREDLESHPEYICAIFCTGCGLEQGITEDGLPSFANYYELDLPTDLSTALIEVDGCQNCDEEFVNPRITTTQD